METDTMATGHTSKVAARAGIDKGALSRLENGQQFNPTVNTLTRYVRALGKSMAWEPTSTGSTSIVP